MKRLSFAEMNEMQADQLGFLQKMEREQGGVVSFKMLWFTMFCLSEPAVIREFLVKHAGDTHRDPFVTRTFRRFMGNGVFVAEGESWRRKRKLVQPAFHATRIRSYAETMAEYTRDMVSDWHRGDLKVLDGELTQLTLRIIAKTMYDVDLLEQTATIGRLMKEILTVAEAQLGAPFLPPQWVPTPLNRRQARARGQIDALLRDIIDERRLSGRDHGDLLSMLLDARDEAGNSMTERELLDECITLFVAGHETTAAALTWAWLLLAQHPDVAERLYAEVDRVLGGQPVTFEKLRDLPLLDAVIKETLRLYPPAFSFGRTVLRPFQIGPHAFPKGAIVLISPFVTHRRPSLYAAPDEFRPERFLSQETQPDRYAYLPFGAGPRVCLGNMFAMMEAAVILATMVQHVRLERTDHAPVERDTLITLRPRDPLTVRVTRREELPVREDDIHRVETPPALSH